MSSSHRRSDLPEGGSRRRAKPGKAGGSGKPKKTGWRRAVPSFKSVLMVGGLGFLAGCVMVGVGYAVTDIPDANAKAQWQATTITYSNGEELAQIGPRSRVAVPLKKMPEHTRKAVLAAENSDFRHQMGISIKGMLRAVYLMLTGGQLQSGSTITQQFVKNYYLTSDQTLVRKAKEIFISIKLDNNRSKDWILQHYMNTIFMGRGAYGIQAAAETYFRKDASELTVSESAMLAGMIQSPNAYDPTDGPEAKAAAKERWNYVLDRMVEEGWLSKSKRQQLHFPQKIHEPKQETAYDGPKAYLVQTVQRKLKSLKFTEDQIRRGGLTVKTTFNKQYQQYLRQAVKKNMPDNWPDGVQLGFVSVEPGTGRVVAMYGGQFNEKDRYGNVFQAEVQVGSTFKPYVLAAALENGIGLKSKVDGDSPQTYPGGYEVKNAGKISYGPVTLLRATQKSINTAYLNLALKVGIPEVAEAAEAAGVPESVLNDPNIKGKAGMALGIASLHPVTQAAGFATFANGGVYAKPHVITQVTDAKGEVLRKVKPKTKQAFSERVNRDVVHAMQRVTTPNGTAPRAALPNRQTAGKTGTTDRTKAAWFAGYTPRLAAAGAMWRGEKSAESQSLEDLPGFARVSGGTIPDRIWHDFMIKALQGKEPKQFPPPANVGQTKIYASPTPSPQPTNTPTAPTTPTTPTVTPTPTAPTTTPGFPTEEPTDGDGPPPPGDDDGGGDDGWPFGAPQPQSARSREER